VALIKRADADRLAREALVLDLADMVRHGEALRRRAEDEAKLTVAHARAERERLVQGAAEAGRREGFAKGEAEGRAKGEAEGRAAALEAQRAAIERTLESWNAALKSFAAARETMLAEARRDVLTLAAAVAERVTKRVAMVDDGVIAAQLEAALRLVSRRTSARVLVSAEDEAGAREVLPGLLAALSTIEHAEIAVDGSLTRGSCVVRTAGGGEIDASVLSQLDRVIAEALPDARRVMAAEVASDGGEAAPTDDADAAGGEA